jgi:hypothetical protein
MSRVCLLAALVLASASSARAEPLLLALVAALEDGAVTVGEPCWLAGDGSPSENMCTFALGVGGPSVGGGGGGAQLPEALTEASGIAASRTRPGVLYTHNDGKRAQLFTLDANNSGAPLAVYRLGQQATDGGKDDGGDKNGDWEDVAVALDPLTATWKVFIGDIGNNDGKRRTVRVYRFDDLPAQPTGQGLTLVHFLAQLEPCLTHKNTLGNLIIP